MANQPIKINKTIDTETALYQITELGFSCKTMEQYYKELHKVINSMTYAANFFIIRFDEASGNMKFVYFKDEMDTNLNVDNLEVLTQEDLRKSASGYLLSSGKMLHMNSEKEKELAKQGYIQLQGSSPVDWLGVPLKHQNEMLGAMVIQSYDLKYIYGEKEENILQFIARQIAMLIKTRSSEQELLEANKRLESRVKERTDSLNRINFKLSNEVEERKNSERIQHALFSITDLVSTTSSLSDFYKKVHMIVSELMFAKNFYIALLDDDGEIVEFAYHVDQIDNWPESRSMKREDVEVGLTERILINGNVILFNRKKEDGKAKMGADCASFLGVPLKDKMRTFGALVVQSYQRDIIYGKNDKKVLVTIGKQIATAILRKKDADSLRAAHESLEIRVKERTSELEDTIVKRRKIEQQLEHDSLHDALTGLPNRLCFSNHLAELLSQEQQQNNESFAVLFLDLDRFKLINDSLGHHIGDLFLIEVAKRLTRCLRGNDFVARLGGDEFCILMRGVDGKKLAISLAARILKDLKAPVDVEKHSLITSASIGIRMSDGNEESAEEVMSDADAAMYRAKHQGKNCFCLFDAEIKQLVTGRMEMENDLREAISKKQLYLVFQPVVDIQEQNVIGCEALIRWEHPIRGLIPPDEFIPVAEETGLIVEIGEYVAEQAVAALAILSKKKETKNVFININVSTIQILTRTFDSFLRNLLLKNGANPKLLNIEITESILIEDYAAAINFVREVKAMGLRVYLDDFGTGFSSLSYLHQFPFDVIKLDKSFIDAMNEGQRNEAIVESIGSMARNLEMKIVAEGVETKEQSKLLKGFDYDYGQGYYFSKPAPLRDMIDLINS